MVFIPVCRQQIEDTERNLLAMSKQHALTPQGNRVCIASMSTANKKFNVNFFQ